MASSTPRVSEGRPPWYVRWFSRRTARLTAAPPNGGGVRSERDPAAPAHPPVMYRCDLCGLSAKSRTYVFDHFKMAHREVFDRNGHICEETEEAAVAKSSG